MVKKDKVKLIVSDFDGTLLPYGESRLSDDVIHTIKDILSRGAYFAVSSGRTYTELVQLLPELSDSIYFTCCDGALTVKGAKPLYERKIEGSDLELFFKAKSEGFSFILHGFTNNYSVGKIPSEAEGFDTQPLSGIYSLKEKIFKITSFGEAPVLPEYSSLRMHWDGGSNSVSQFVNRYSNKGTALSDLQTRLMVTKFDTVILGDRGNDLAMVKGAKASFCIGDRCKELSNVCNYSFASGIEALKYISENLI